MQYNTILNLLLYIDNMTYVRMTTSAGEIDIQLYTEECPETTNNFLKLVDDGFYDGLHFHRVIKDFMIKEDAHIQAMQTMGEPEPEVPAEDTL